MSRYFKRAGLVVAASLAALIGLAAMLSWAQAAQAGPLGALLAVSNTHDSGPGSLRQAILDANATAGPDVISITAAGTLALLSPLPSITETVTIQGAGAGACIVDGGNLYRPFEVDSGAATISGLTIQRGSAGLFGSGGGIRSFGPLTLTSVVVMSSTAMFAGGGVDAEGTLFLSGTQVLGNSSGLSGGGVYAFGPTTISRGLIQGNTCSASSCDGGGAYVSNTLALSNVPIIGNSATEFGAGTYAAGSVTLSGGLFQDNHCEQATCAGGGLYAGATLALTGTQFISNVVDNRGGGLLAAGAGTLHGGLFQGNRCTDPECTGGGAWFANGPATLSGTQFISNTAVIAGGGLFGNGVLGSSGELIAIGAQFISNTAEFAGGGLAWDGPVTLNDTQFLSNTAVAGVGGGAEANGDVTANGGLFQNNRCSGHGCTGGGLYVHGALTLSQTQLIDNWAFSAAGGAETTGDMLVEGGTIQGNHCDDMSCTGGGLVAGGLLTASGGLFTDNTSNGLAGAAYATSGANLSATQFLTNSAVDGGGGVYATGGVVLNNGAFAGNSCLTPACLGGGLYTTGTMAMTETQFIGNQAGVAIVGLTQSNARPATEGGGGGAAASGAVTLTAGMFQGNTCLVTCLGGGLYTQGSLAMSGTQFINNSADTAGGGAFALAGVRLNGGLFQGNQCPGTECSGGGLAAVNGLAMTGTLFINNNAAANGGGLALDGGGGTLVNVLFAGNTSALSGTAVALFPSANVTLSFVTIGSDLPVSGAAVFVGNGAVNLVDTIIANHSVGIATGSQFGAVTQDYNLFYAIETPVTGAVNSGAHNVFGDPNFVNVAADDYHLGPGSAAIDAGTNAGVATDFEGDARPQGRGFDIGYDEFTRWRIDLPLVQR